MKSGWLNLDLLEFLSALSFLVFLFIKYEEIPAIFLEKIAEETEADGDLP